VTAVGAWKILTARTLREWLMGERRDWHLALGAPILTSPGLRGSALLLLTPEYVQHAAEVVWWSVADIGGVRAGLSPLPSELADQLQQPPDRLRTVLDAAAEDEAVARAVVRHTPLPRWLGAQVLPERVQIELDRRPYEVYSWFHEVLVRQPPPVSSSVVARLVVPNVMLNDLRRDLPPDLRKLVQGYNPALGLEVLTCPQSESAQAPMETPGRRMHPRAQLWCIGVYESRLAEHFPFHATPILAYAEAPNSWRREVYEIQKPYRLAPRGRTGPARPLERLSVRRGDYIVTEPRLITTRTQVIVVGPDNVVLVTGPAMLLRALMRGLLRCEKDRVRYLRRTLVTACNWMVARLPGTRPCSPTEDMCAGET
jgi:hypothetical protein